MSGPGVSRGRWRRWPRSWPLTGTPACPACSPQRRTCYRRRSSRSWSGRRSSVSTRSVSKSCKRWPSTQHRCRRWLSTICCSRSSQPSTAARCCPGWSTCTSPAVTQAATTCTRWTVTTPSAASRRASPMTETRGPSPFTRYALQARAADYFEQTRTPRDSWRSLDDLAAQLAEFELRCANADYDTAAVVLADIDFDYLQKWGHYRLAADMHERLSGRLTDPYWQMVNAGNLGNIYSTLGQTEKAIDYYQQALAIARETGNRGIRRRVAGRPRQHLPDPGADREGDRPLPAGPGHRPRNRQPRRRRRMAGQPRQHLPDPGADREGDRPLPAGPGHRPRNRQPRLRRRVAGQSRQHLPDPGADREGDRATTSRPWPSPAKPATAATKARWLGNLGDSYADLGQTEKAIEHYQQALAIARETGNRGREGAWLGNLGNSYRILGQTEKAIELLPAGPGHRPRNRQPRQGRRLAGRPRRQLPDPGADRGGDRPLPAGPGHRPRNRRPRQGRCLAGRPRQQLPDPGADRGGDRPLPAGPGHRPRNRRPRQGRRLAGRPRQELPDPGADRGGDRPLPAGPGHRPRNRRPQR